MPRVVHRDHGTEVLGQLRRLITDDDALRRAEDLGMAAGMEHVVEAGHRPVPAALLEAVLNELGVV